MMRLLFAFVLVLTFQAGDTPTPPPFDPAQIFVDGINPEYIVLKPYEGMCHNFSVHADPDTRTLYVCDEPGGQWQRFPFPDGAEDFPCDERRSDGTWAFMAWNETLVFDTQEKFYMTLWSGIIILSRPVPVTLPQPHAT